MINLITTTKFTITASNFWGNVGVLDSVAVGNIYPCTILNRKHKGSKVFYSIKR